MHGTTYASQIARNANGTAIIEGERKSYNKIVKTTPDQKDEYVKVTTPVYKYTNTMLFPPGCIQIPTIPLLEIIVLVTNGGGAV